MTDVADAVQADRELKAKHAAMWGSGDYADVADRVIPDLGAVLVEACGVGPGDRVLDVAAGSGNAAIPAARTGADVVAADLTPQLLEAGRVRAEQRGVALEWREADAEALPFADGEFDVTMSCLGIMFAPHHQASADQLVRVCRPGGRVGLLSWTPEGFVGEMFAVTKGYSAPPPPGAQPPPLWGNEEHVRTLLGDRVTDVKVSRQTVHVDCFSTPEEFRTYFKTNYGPVVATYKLIGGEPGRSEALDEELDRLAERYDTGAAGSTVMEWEYLLLTATRTS